MCYIIFVVHIGKFFSPYDGKGSTKSAVVIIHLRKTTATLCVNGTFLNTLNREDTILSFEINFQAIIITGTDIRGYLKAAFTYYRIDISLY